MTTPRWKTVVVNYILHFLHIVESANYYKISLQCFLQVLKLFNSYRERKKKSWFLLSSNALFLLFVWQSREVALIKLSPTNLDIQRSKSLKVTRWEMVIQTATKIPFISWSHHSFSLCYNLHDRQSYAAPWVLRHWDERSLSFWSDQAAVMQFHWGIQSNQKYAFLPVLEANGATFLIAESV